MKKSLIIGALLLIIGIVAGWLCREYHFRGEVKMMQNDTVFLVDTHIIEKPVLVERTNKETLLVEVHDTTRINDTLYIGLPMESKTYKGEDYLAVVSGYEPSLDRIEVYPKTKIVREYIGQPATNYNTLSFGIEPRYMNTLSIPIYLEYGRMLHKNVEIYGQIAYDLPSKSFGIGAGMKIQIGW